MKQNNVSSIRKMLEQMTTQQLDEMLDRELHKEPADENAIRLILDILKQREKDMPVEVPAEMAEAWEKFRSRREQPKVLRLPSWMLRAASVVLVIGLLFAALPQEAQAETFFERLARLTADIVEFFGPKDDEARLEEYVFQTDNPGLQQVYDAVVEMGVTEPVVPMWLGDDAEFNWIETAETPRKKGLTVCFIVDGKEAMYKLDIHTEDISHQYYKDETQLETIELHGIKHSITQNDGKWIVIWLNDNYECSIAIDCHEDTLYRILSSIYEME